LLYFSKVSNHGKLHEKKYDNGNYLLNNIRFSSMPNVQYRNKVVYVEKQKNKKSGKKRNSGKRAEKKRKSGNFPQKAEKVATLINVYFSVFG
jgi:hypothetical protein